MRKREIKLKDNIIATLSGEDINTQQKFNRVTIKEYESNNIQMKLFCDDNLIYDAFLNESDGFCKKTSELIIRPKNILKFHLGFKNAFGSDYLNVDVIDTIDQFCNIFKDFLIEYPSNTVKSISEEETSEKREKVFQKIGIISVIIQFVFFLIAKFNLKNTYNEEVIGKIQMGNMIGADTSVSHSSSTTGLGVFAAVMMGVCCISFFVLAGLSAKKGTGKYMPLFGVFAVVTIIGGIIVAVY